MPYTTHVWKITLQMNTNLQKSSWIFPVTDKHIGIKKDEINKRSFLKLSFANKGIDAINLGNILHHKSVKSKIPPCFKYQSVSIISYTYTTHISTKIYNYNNLNIDDFKSKV